MPQLPCTAVRWQFAVASSFLLAWSSSGTASLPDGGGDKATGPPPALANTWWAGVGPAEPAPVCDVVVVGGSTAGLAAAVTAAQEGARACLLEPTDMVGGQMNNIPAFDFSMENGCKPFNVSGAAPDTLSSNMAFGFDEILHTLPPPGCATCWVSQYCFLPTQLQAHALRDLLESAGPNLTVFYETVLVGADTGPARGATPSQTKRVEAVRAVQRRARPGAPCGGYEERLSTALPDWYSPSNSSAVWEKLALTFTAPVFLDASYNGELLALAGAPYLQGADERFDGDTSGQGNDTLGQSFTMTLHIHMLNHTVPASQGLYPPMDTGWAPNPFMASPAIHTPDHKLTWPELWTRRRSYHPGVPNSSAPSHTAPPGTQPPPMSSSSSAASASVPGAGAALGMDPPAVNVVSAGDVHLAAWPDFYYGYVFVSKAEAAAQVKSGDWVGGYNIASIDGAERYSYGAYQAYVNHAATPPEWRNHSQLNSTFLGTCTGLSKMPYIRDGRRSIGLGGFLVDINFTAAQAAHPCADGVALAGHGFDIWGHRMMPYEDDYPAYMRDGGSTGDILVPLRALTNRDVENLLVAGLAMAQSFMVNSALRMHPEEFSNGVAAGAAAAQMVLGDNTSSPSPSPTGVRSTGELVASQVEAVRARVLRHAPLQWSHAP